VLVRDGFALPALYAEIDALDSKIDGQAQLGLYQAVGRLVYGQTVWFLRNGDSAPLGDRIAALAAARRTIEPKLAQMLPADMRARHEARVAALAQSGAPAKLAERLALLGFAELVPEMAQVAKLGNVSVDAAAKAILAINAHFRIGRIEEAARTIAPTDYYDGLALSRAHDMIAAARRGMAVTALLQHSQAADPVAEWIASGGERIGRARERLQNLTESGEISLSRLSVAAGLMNDLTGL
jgi:glutamate dehydrogenase